MTYIYKCQSCKVLGEMEELEEQVQCPQCGGVMLPLKDETGTEVFTGDDLDAPTVAVPKEQILKEIAQEQGGQIKRPVKIAKAVDLGFGGLLSKSATGSYKRPTQQPQAEQRSTVKDLQPAPLQQEQIPSNYETYQEQVPVSAPQPKPVSSGQTTASGKKKFVINRQTTQKPLPASGTTAQMPYVQPQTPKQQQVPPKPAPASQTSQKKVIFQTSMRQTSAGIPLNQTQSRISQPSPQKQPIPQSHSQSTVNTQKKISFQTNKPTQFAQKPQPTAPQIKQQNISQKPITQPPEKTSVPLKGKLITQPKPPQPPPSVIPPAQAPVNTESKEMESLLAEKKKIEADEATRREMILKEAQRIAEEQIRLAKEEAERLLAEERARLAKKAAEDAEMTRKIAEEAAKKAIQESSALFSEKIAIEKQKAQLEAEDRIRQEMEKLEQLKKELEEKRKRAEEKVESNITPEQITSPQEKKEDLPELKSPVQADKENEQETQEPKIKEETSQEEKKEKADELPELSLANANKAEDIFPSSEKNAEEKEAETKKEESTSTKDDSDKEDIKETENKDESKAEEDKKTEKSNSKSTEEKDKKISPTQKKPLFPDKKKKAPFIPQKKAQTSLGKELRKAKEGAKIEEDKKEKSEKKVSTTSTEKSSQTKTNKSTDTKVASANITNSGLIRLKTKKTQIIYVIISIGALIVCVFIIWLGTLFRRFLERRAAKKSGAAQSIIKKTTKELPPESKFKVEYMTIYNRVKNMSVGSKPDIDKVIAEWDAFITKYPNDQNDEYIRKAKAQRDTMLKLREMY